MLTTLNGTAQAVLPNWVRGRGLAVYLTLFFGTMTAGSLVWGQVASLSSLDAALVAAGLLAGALALASRLLPLPAGDEDLTPSNHWPEPIVAEGVEAGGGPVLGTITYEVDLADQPAFATAAQGLRSIRRRDGAQQWALMRDAAEPRLVTEWFLVGSWEQHLRQHARVAVADRVVQEQVRSFHRGAEPPRVHHLLSIAAELARPGHRGGVVDESQVGAADR